jgi:molecular chaperone GrpE
MTDTEQDDVQFEAENNEPPKGGDAERRVAKLKAELEQVKAERQEYMDGWQRAKADYVNMLKRIETEGRSMELRGRIKAVETLLPAFDALERAKEHAELPAGFDAIVRQLESAFKALGLEAVGEVGESFDPSLYEALGQEIVAEEEKDDKITTLLERGWRIGDTIIRPAKVRVGRFEK